MINRSLWLVAALVLIHTGFVPLLAQSKDFTAKGEIRGVWIHPSYFGTEKDQAIAKICATLDEYAHAGIKTLIVLVKSTSGLVYYRSAIAPVDSAWKWDFFGVFLQEAHSRKMIVHPWFCVFTEGARAGEVNAHPEWLIRSTNQEPTGVVNPALRDVRQYEISLMTELVRRYPVEWIHLDYIRYPCDPTEVFFSFDEQTRKLFEGYAGEDPLGIKHKNSGNVTWNEWIEWNAEHVTRFVRELKQALRVAKRPVKISAAVFPDAVNAKVLIGQDWGGWAKEGLVDMFCPMLYTNRNGLFEKYLRRAVDIAQGHSQVCAGIGIGTAHNQNKPSGLLEQLKISRNLQADGVIFFSAASLKDEFLGELKKIK